MNCPHCSKRIKEDASICPYCDAILDESILGAMPEDNDEDEDTPAPAPPPAPRRKLRAPIDTPERPRRAAARPSAPAPSPGGYVNKYSQYWTDDDEPAPRSAARSPAERPERAAPDPAAPAGEAGGGTGIEDPLEQVKAIWDAFMALGFEDKITCGSAIVLSVMSFMPWRSTLEGEQLGFFSWGFFTALLGLATVGAIWARRTGRFPSLPPRALSLAPLGTGGLSALITVVFALTSFEREVQYGQSVLVGSPSAGVYLSILGAAGIVLGGLLSSRRG